jgi:hypothetical protein
VPAKGIAIVATINLPENARRPDSAVAACSSTTALPAADSPARSEISQGVYLYGDAVSNRLALRAADLAVKVSTGGVELKAGVSLDYTTIPGKDIDASTTPLRGTIAIRVGSSGAAFALTAGVDSSVVPDGEVLNAFGTKDLTIRQLAVEMEFSRRSASRRRPLPPAWGDKIGITPGTKILLGAKISVITPCLTFQIGRPKDAAGKTIGSRFAIDFANTHMVYAESMGLLIAPVGCQIGPVKIEPGFGVDFNAWVGVTFQIKIIASIALPSPTFKGVAIKTDIAVDAWTMGPVKFDKTKSSSTSTRWRAGPPSTSSGVHLWNDYAVVDFVSGAGR